MSFSGAYRHAIQICYGTVANNGLSTPQIAGLLEANLRVMSAGKSTCAG